MLAALLFLVGCITPSLGAGRDYYTFFVNGTTNEVTVAEGKDTSGVAWGKYHDDVEATGWGKLLIETNMHIQDELQMYGAGYLEGWLTHHRIYQNKLNFFMDVYNSTDELPAPFIEWVATNDQWTREQVALNPTDTYWYQVGLALQQLQGLIDGYAVMALPAEQMSRMDFIALNLAGGDAIDILPATTGVTVLEMRNGLKRAHTGRRNWESMSKSEAYTELTLRSKCSSLVKFTGHELYSGHNTWADFAQMLRIFKTYIFGLRSTPNAQAMMFSSYPGLLYSNDDAYTVYPSMLAVYETTNTVMNDDLYVNLTTSSVLYYIRVMVASRLALTAPEWVEVFGRNNSWTYNNQQIIVDYKLFTPNMSALEPDTVWISEQMPGTYLTKDVSPIISEQGYWPSFNRPYFPEIFDGMGYKALADKWGNGGGIFSYNDTARYLIFQRDQGAVESLEDYKHLMSYNNWQADPLSNGFSGDTIASRYDLQVPTWRPEEFLMRGAHGNIDCKVVSHALINEGLLHAISGPTHENQPPFSWDNDEWRSILHHGHPKVFAFDWEVMMVQW